MSKIIALVVTAAFIAALFFLYIPSSDGGSEKSEENGIDFSEKSPSSKTYRHKNNISADQGKEDDPALGSEGLDGEEAELNAGNANGSFESLPENYQEDLPPEFMEKALEEFEKNAPNMTPPPDMDNEAMLKMEKSDLQDTISLNELPAPIADEMRKDLEFREKEGYDRESDEEASTVKSILSNLSGTSADIPNLTFELSALPSTFTESYQYVGYAYQPGTEEEKSHSTVKRVFSKHSDNSIVVFEETSLASGSATLTTEFVNQEIYNCPAILVEKRNKIYGDYAQLNWNTRDAGFVILQFDTNPLKHGLVDLAESISRLNDSNSCDQSQADDQSSP